MQSDARGKKEEVDAGSKVLVYFIRYILILKL